MSDWLSFELADILMFSPETYFRLFELTNADMWPAQIVALVVGVTILALTLRGSHIRDPKLRGRLIAALLAVTWLAVAWFYFFERYATINLAAPYFAWGFITQALFLAVSGIAMGRLTFNDAKQLRGKSFATKMGVALFIYALLLQPLIGAALGRAWSGVELFGIAPDPTVLATLGVLLAADRVRWELFVLPLLWCAISGITLSIMGAPEAWLMPLTAVFSLGLAVARRLRGGA